MIKVGTSDDARLLSRHWEKTNEAIFFDPFFLAKTGVWQKTVITTRLGVKKYAGWCTRIPKSSSDDPCLALFHFFCIFLIRLFVLSRHCQKTNEKDAKK